MDNLRSYVVPLGRLLLSSLFIWAGYNKLFGFGPAGTAGYFADNGVPLPQLAAWIAIIVELVGGIMILIGLQARWVALALAIWCLVTAFGWHLPAGSRCTHDQLLQESEHGGRFSLRVRLRRRRVASTKRWAPTRLHKHGRFALALRLMKVNFRLLRTDETCGYGCANARDIIFITSIQPTAHDGLVTLAFPAYCVLI